MFDGVAAFVGGVRFIVGRPSVWGLALFPAFVAALLFFGIGALCLWGASALVDHVLQGFGSGAWREASAWLLRLVFWAVGILVALLAALSFAQPLSGFALDAIAQKQEVALGGGTWPAQPMIASAVRAFRVTLTALAMSLPVLAVLSLVTIFVPPASVVTIPLKFLVIAMATAYDFLDYPLSIRGAGVRSRMRFIQDHLGAVVGFGASAAAILLLPGIGLFLLPFGVAGATRLVVRADGLARYGSATREHSLAEGPVDVRRRESS